MRKRNWLQLVGTWQVAGGALSSVAFLDAIPRLRITQDLRTTVLASLLPLCALSILAGVALLRGTRAALVPSIVVQVAQIFAVSGGRTAYQLVLGPYLYVGSTSTWTGIAAGVAPQFQFHVNANGVSEGFAVNLLASFFAVVLVRAYRRRNIVPGAAPSDPLVT